MSRAVLMRILSGMRVWLGELEMGQLYSEPVAYFGLGGALNEGQVLENAWKDPYNRREIEGFIKAWLSRKQRKGEEILTGVV